MAKSIRSKSKRAFRVKKRTDVKSVFAQADKARADRIAAKLHAKGDVEMKDAEEAASTTMPLDQQQEKEPAKKISTSGPKQSNRVQWKAKRGLTKPKKLSASTTFEGRSSRRGKDGRVKA